MRSIQMLVRPASSGITSFTVDITSSSFDNIDGSGRTTLLRRIALANLTVRTEKAPGVGVMRAIAPLPTLQYMGYHRG